jgi:hypothetical protein
MKGINTPILRSYPTTRTPAPGAGAIRGSASILPPNIGESLKNSMNFQPDILKQYPSVYSQRSPLASLASRGTIAEDSRPDLKLDLSRVHGLRQAMKMRNG